MKNIFKSAVIALFAVLSALAQENKKTKILFVLTSNDKLGDTGKPTGSWIEEFATPYYYFLDKGIEVVIATPKGGQAPIDPKSNDPSFQTPSTKRYYADKSAQKALSTTVKLSAVKEQDFKAVFYPGGHGPMWDLPNDKNSIKIIQSFYNNNKPVAFVCHAPAALVNVKDKNGNYFIAGKKLTAFSNTEEAAVELTKVVPFSLEDKLKEHGGVYSKGADWSSYVLEDGLLITGQNPQSSEQVASKILAKIK
ncbi:type 1 glutamine amidotransferase domain-containing protein [Flavobacterium branchiicola]|uniref:Type 1 glutamine amidotransferase domain-containing protein n=1 Tax=Flavobacterium branchiicola TaxID=1114875 RepID=A0ABV9PC12_9FLAO|nr:type 1 glutamine amidotransferase domain-containing protein [Flavobacterium branchiicola]MBS7254015.1 type 1 glutamine amidotransferase domain-containing protein [Flavobacterium branchiicola]